jgi:hypothetical protein
VDISYFLKFERAKGGVSLSDLRKAVKIEGDLRKKAESKNKTKQD